MPTSPKRYNRKLANLQVPQPLRVKTIMLSEEKASSLFFQPVRLFRENKDRQAKMNDKNRRFGVLIMPL